MIRLMIFTTLILIIIAGFVGKNNYNDEVKSCLIKDGIRLVDVGKGYYICVDKDGRIK